MEFAKFKRIENLFLSLMMHLFLLCILINPFHASAGMLSNESGRVLLPFDNRFKMHVNGDKAYIASYAKEQLDIVDISDKRNPKVQSISPVNHIAYSELHDIWYSNNMVYIAHRGGGVTKIDVSNSTTPTVYSRCMETNYTHNGLITAVNPASQKEVLYVADHGSPPLFRVYDPQTNLQLYQLLSTGSGREIEVTSDGKYLFQAVRDDARINIYNVKNAANNITLYNTINTFASEMVISPDSKYLYILYDQPTDDKNEGVAIYDVSSPASPTFITSIPLSGARELTVDYIGKRLFVRTRSDLAVNPVPTGIYAFDIKNLSLAKQIDFLPTVADREDFDIWYDNEYLYYTDNTDSGSQLIVIHVGSNNAPIATNQNVVTEEDNAVRISLNASDPDGDPLSYVISIVPKWGTLSGIAPELIYTPIANFNGSDQFSYTVNDGLLQTTATVSITVNPVNDIPIISPIPAQKVDEGSHLEFQISATDADNDVLTITAGQLPNGATFENGKFSWTPGYDQAGRYDFYYTVADPYANVISHVVVTVNNVNRAPTSNAQGVTTNEDDAVAVTLSGNDPDGDALTYQVTSMPAKGTLSGTAPNLTYTPNANYNGSDMFKFTVSDGHLSSEATVSITINSVNDAPVLNNIPTQSVAENSVLTFSVAGSDVDGDALTFSATNIPSGATFNNGTFTWTPNFNQAGTYKLTVSVSDGKLKVSQDVNITVNNVNRTPSTNSLSVTTDEDKAITVNLSGSDPDGDVLTYKVTSMPTNGTLSGIAPNLTYTPTANYNGSDKFTFTVSDGDLSAEATVSINVNSVNDAPILNNIPAQSVAENSPLTFTAIGSDADGDALIFSAKELPSGATFNNGIFTWTPAFDQAGTYTVTVSVSDGNKTVSQDVNITVNNVNRAPSADAKSVTTNEDNAIAVTLSGSDPDGEALTYKVISIPTNGTLSGTAPNLTYTPTANYNGSDEFTFTVSDGDLSAEATVSINVNSVNDAPVLNNIPAQSVAENSPLTFTATGSDADGDALTFSAKDLPSGATFNNGTFTWTPAFDQASTYTVTVSVNDGNETISQDVVVKVNNVNRAPLADAKDVTTNEDNAVAVTLSGSDPDGEALTYKVISIPTNGTLSGTAPNLTYTPTANYNGSDEFTFTINDGDLSAEATVTINVNSVNDAPVLNNIPAQSVAENSPLTFTVTGSDADGDALTFSAKNSPSGATFNNGTFTWTPAFDQAGNYTVTISVTDGNETVSQDVVVKVTNVNRAPSADAKDVTTNEDNAIAITLSGSDPDGEALTYKVTSIPTHGTLSGTAPNLTYTPNANYNGSDEFTVTINDGDLSAEATVTINVNSVNDAPVLNNIPGLSVAEKSTLTFTATGSDADGDTLTFSAKDLPSGATFNNGTFTWTPNFNQAGTYKLTVSVSDGKLKVSQDVNITVNNVNRTPSTNSLSVTTDEDKAITVTLSGSDSDGDALTYQVTSMPAEGTLSGTAPNLTYTPNANYNGSDQLTFTVSDGDLSAEATVTINVNSVNDAPVLNSIPAQLVAENSSLTFTATGSDADGDELTFSAENLPSGATFNNGVFTWTPAFDQAGIYTITISVTDGVLTTSGNVAITVINTPEKVKVFMYDEALSNPSASNPRLYVVNVGNETISNCRIEYYFSTENDKVPQLDVYYTANAKVTLANRGNGEYTIIYDLSGINLAPGAVYPNYGGMVVGIRYNDWSTVDVRNDYSNNQARSFVENNKICVYNSEDRLLNGLKPSNTNILPFANAGKDIWSTNTQAKLDASLSYDLLGSITGYEWIINGSVVSTSISPTLSFNYGVSTVTLRVINSKGLSSTDSVNVYVPKENGVLFVGSPDPVAQNTSYTVEYYVPSKLAGCSIVLEAQNAWGSTNVVNLSGSSGYHNEKIWGWIKSSLGGSGPWTVRCKVNGMVTQTLNIKFNY